MKLNYKTINIRLVIFSLLFCMLFYFPVFHHLERLPILMWDESLFSLRALYIHLTGNYLYNFNLFEGMPDHANTKLPFTTWFQVISFKIFGVSELALRLPIGLIFSLTVIYIVGHFKAQFSNIWAGFVFGFVSITSTGFVSTHMLRTGDQDAPFACYMLIAAIAFLQYLESRKWKPLLVFTFFSLAALLTKNLLAGLLAPGLLLFALLTRQLTGILKEYKFWFACFVIAGVYSGLVIYYEMQYPGFLKRMWNYELVGRFTNAIENHDKPPFFYLTDLAFNKFIPYFFFLPIVFSLAFAKNITKQLRHSILGISAVLFCYLFIISFSKTQTPWYIAPVYLLGAYIIALGAVVLFEYLYEQPKRFRTIFFLCLLPVSCLLYAQVLIKNLNPKPFLKDEKYGQFMEIIAKKKPALKHYTVADNNFGASARFYVEMYNLKETGYHISFQRSLQFNNNQLVMACLNNVINPINKRYYTEIIKQWEDCILLKVLSEKNIQIKTKEE